MKLSNRIQNTQESPIRKLVPYSEQAKQRGMKVYHLNIGQPDIQTPDVFLKAIQEVDQQVIEYSFSQGDPKLIEGIRNYYKRYNMDFSSEDIIITNGGSEAIAMALLTCCDHGDNILVPEPYYSNYNGLSTPYGVEIIPITTLPENNFALPSYEEIVSLITDKTRAILISNPSNPTGAVLSIKEVELLAKIAKEHDLFLLSDEVYREFIYDGYQTCSVGEIEQIEDNAVIIDSISKRFSACGARIGCILSKNKDFMSGILKLAQGRLCVPTLEMIGATALYNLSSDTMIPMVENYKSRRNTLLEGLQAIDGVQCKIPHGAFYVIAKLPVNDAEDFSMWLLKEFSYEKKTVMLAPAQGFYATPGLGIDEVRIAYVLKEDDLKECVKLLDIALKEYNRIQK